MNLRAKSKNFVLIILMLFVNNQFFNAQKSKNAENEEFVTGADQPEKYLPLLKGKSVGVVTNQTGLVTINKKKQSIVDFLKENGVAVKRVFAPEHGFRGVADAGEVVKNGVDTKTGIPIVSLYANTKKPTPAHMKDLDVILFDIQDVGVRFYTYISTLAYVMEAGAENGVEIIVLDRPNPHDGYTDGPVLRKEWTSFVGLHPVPVVYGLTIGEYGKMVNAGLLAAEFIQSLPANETPSTTRGFEGFYHLLDLKADVSEAKLQYIIRDHDEQKFENRKKFITEKVAEFNQKYGENVFEIEIKEQYLNMKKQFEGKMHIIEVAERAMKNLGITPEVKAIRGGTDGAQLSYMGLPCPNIFAGGLNFHGPYEYVPLESMEKATEVIIEIAKEVEKL